MSPNPFDQPDVEAAKISARALMTGGSGTRTPIETGALDDAVALVERGDTIALQAYVPATAKVLEALPVLQTQLRTRTKAAVTVGIGPRFLHSTGQLHKGGSALLVAIQLVSSSMSELPVPETDITLGEIISSQADGDAQVLIDRGIRFVRIVVDDVFPVLE